MSVPNENIAIGGLPSDITDDKVRSAIGHFGRVAQAKVLPPVPGRSDREAFVRMSTLEEAKWMVQNIQDNVLDGMVQPVVVRFSTHKGPLSPWGGLPAATIHVGHAVAAASGLAVPPGAAMPTGYLTTPSAGYLTPSRPAPAMVQPSIQCPVGVMTGGIVRRWDTSKGFGFVGPDLGGPDVFVHVRELTDGDTLVPGTRVTFEAAPDPGSGPGRLRAKVCMGAQKSSMALQGGVVVPPATRTAFAPDRLIIHGIPLDSSEETLSSVFGQYGTLLSIQKVPAAAGGSDASVMLHMQDPDEAKWLVDNVNQNIPLGLSSVVSISYAPVPTPTPAVPQLVLPPKPGLFPTEPAQGATGPTTDFKWPGGTGQSVDDSWPVGPWEDESWTKESWTNESWSVDAFSSARTEKGGYSDDLYTADGDYGAAVSESGHNTSDRFAPY